MAYSWAWNRRSPSVRPARMRLWLQWSVSMRPLFIHNHHKRERSEDYNLAAHNSAKINVDILKSTGRFSASRLQKSKRLCWGRRRKDTARSRRYYTWSGENTNKCWPMKNQPRIRTMIFRDFNNFNHHFRLSQLKLKLQLICWRYTIILFRGGIILCLSLILSLSWVKLSSWMFLFCLSHQRISGAQ